MILEPAGGVNPHLRLGNGTTPLDDPQEKQSVEGKDPRVALSIFTLLILLFFSVAFLGFICNNLIYSIPKFHGEGWYLNCPRIQIIELITIPIASILSSKISRNGFSSILIPIFLLLLMVVIDLNPKFERNRYDQDNLVLFIASWMLGTAIRVIFEIMLINLICRFMYSNRYAILTTFFTLYTLIRTIQATSNDRGVYWYEELVRVEYKEIIYNVLITLFFASSIFSSLIWSFSDPDNGELVDILGFKI